MHPPIICKRHAPDFRFYSDKLKDYKKDKFRGLKIKPLAWVKALLIQSRIYYNNTIMLNANLQTFKRDVGTCYGI